MRSLTLAFLAATAAAGLAGCDSILGSDDTDIVGTWAASSGGWSEIVEITADSVTVYTQEADDECWRRVPFERVGRDGSTHTLRAAGTAITLDVRIEGVDDGLRIRNETQTGQDWIVYEDTDDDPDALELCTGGGADASVPCQELPALTPGGSTTGALTADDPTGPGEAHYDVFGLQLTAGTDVVLGLESAAFDPVLWLYTANGSLLLSNDDADPVSGDTDARLLVTLPAGCYRVEATSFTAGATGEYTLEALGG